MSQNGKGDKNRPKTVDYDTWNKNWENIFGTKTKKKSSKAVDKTITDDRMNESQQQYQSSG